MKKKKKKRFKKKYLAQIFIVIMLGLFFLSLTVWAKEITAEVTSISSDIVKLNVTENILFEPGDEIKLTHKIGPRKRFLGHYEVISSKPGNLTLKILLESVPAQKNMTVIISKVSPLPKIYNSSNSAKEDKSPQKTNTEQEKAQSLLGKLKHNKSASSFKRVQWIDQIADLRTSFAVPTLIEIILNLKENGEVRMSAIRALGSIGSPKAVPALLKTLKTDLVERKGYWAPTIKALGVIGDSRAVPQLISVLRVRENDDMGKRSMAARALGRIGDSRAVLPLISAAKNPHIRKEAIWALAKIKDERATGVLVNALQQGEDDETVIYATEGLKKLGSKAREVLEKAASKPVEKESTDIVQVQRARKLLKELDKDTEYNL